MIDYTTETRPKGFDKAITKEIIKLPEPSIFYPKFEQIILHIDELERRAKEIEIKGQPEREVAVSLGVTVSKLIKQLIGAKEDITSGPRAFVQAINNHVNVYTNLKKQGRLDKIKSLLEGKVGAYNYKLELEQKEQEKKARELAEKEQARLDAEAKEKGIEAPKIPELVVPKYEKQVRTDEGMSYGKEQWDFEVVDESKIPDIYKVVDESKIRRAVKQGVRKIDGVRIFETSKVVFRK